MTVENKARKNTLEQLRTSIYDVAVIGGGISGACIYHHLCSKGYRTLIIDKNDFASGTSQASAMMIWGGLLYLRNMDLGAVCRFSRARNRMLRKMPDLVSPCSFRYIPTEKGTRNKHFVHAALYLYWLLGLLKQHRPRNEASFEEATLLKHTAKKGSLVYQEALLNVSDCRFVLHWITPHIFSSSAALNYCSLMRAEYQPTEKLWYLDLGDELISRQISTRARCIINSAGVWTDEVNSSHHISSPYKHVLSKGVFIGLKREPLHRRPLILETGQHGDAISYIPWGPIALWGPTESVVNDLDEGFTVVAKDIEFLLDQADRHLKSGISKSSVVSFRCGIRPLAVKKTFSGDCFPLDLSRIHRIAKLPGLPWISVYGGKITGCISLAKTVVDQVSKIVPPAGGSDGHTPAPLSDFSVSSFPGLDDSVPSLHWCMKNELCCTLEDYLRRRTNVAQWVFREGLGLTNENVPYLRQLAIEASSGNKEEAEKRIKSYCANVERRFDDVLRKL